MMRIGTDDDRFSTMNTSFSHSQSTGISSQYSNYTSLHTWHSRNIWYVFCLYWLRVVNSSWRKSPSKTAMIENRCKVVYIADLLFIKHREYTIVNVFTAYWQWRRPMSYVVVHTSCFSVRLAKSRPNQLNYCQLCHCQWTRHGKSMLYMFIFHIWLWFHTVSRKMKTYRKNARNKCEKLIHNNMRFFRNNSGQKWYQISIVIRHDSKS